MQTKFTYWNLRNKLVFNFCFSVLAGNSSLEKVHTKIEKKTTTLRKPTSAGERLAIFKIFLVTGETSLWHQYQLNPLLPSIVLLEVCDAIVEAFAGEYMHFLPNKE